MLNVILVFVLCLLVAGAGLYIYRAKKNGEVCIGCPHAKQCSNRSCCSAKRHSDNEK